jgi:hypothetical protein
MAPSDFSSMVDNPSRDVRRPAVVAEQIEARRDGRPLAAQDRGFDRLRDGRVDRAPREQVLRPSHSIVSPNTARPPAATTASTTHPTSGLDYEARARIGSAHSMPTKSSPSDAGRAALARGLAHHARGNARAALGERDRIVPAIVEDQRLDGLAGPRDRLRDALDLRWRGADHQRRSDIGMASERRQRARLQLRVLAISPLPNGVVTTRTPGTARPMRRALGPVSPVTDMTST